MCRHAYLLNIPSGNFLWSGRIGYVYHWFEIQQRKGFNREELFLALIQWIQEKGNTKALALVAKIFSINATRIEYAKLEEIDVKINDYKAVLDETKFDVFNRTLA